MKRLLSIIVVACICTLVNAQVVEQEFTQARALDVVSNAYVKPLVTEIKVGNRFDESIEIDAKKYENDLDNIRAYAVYRMQKRFNCDIILAPTFNISSTKSGCVVNVIGYPGTFYNMRTMVDEDMKWMTHEKVVRTSEREKIDAVIKPASIK